MRCVVLCVRCPGRPGSCSRVYSLGALCCVCCVLGHSATVQRCARSACCVVCAVSWATWLLFTGVLAQRAVLRVRCPGPLGSCSAVCPLGVLCLVCGVLGLLAPVHRCARSVRCVACVRCPGPLGSCSPVCPLGLLCCVCGVHGQLAPVQRCAGLVRCLACAVSWATWPLFTCLLARCVVLRVRCPRPLGSCSPVCSPGAVRYVCAVSCVTWLLFNGVHASCAVLRVRCPRPRGSCSPVCSLGALCAVSWAPWLLFTGVLARCGALRVCGVLGHLAPVQRCAQSVCCVACALSWVSWLLFTGVLARCVLLLVVLCLRCPGRPGSCSPVYSRRALCCVCCVLGHLAPVQRCARSACCVVCAVSWATWLLFTGVLAQRAVLRVRCPGPLGSCSAVCPLAVLCCVCGVLGLLAPVHRCAGSACCVACAVSWATWILFTRAHACCAVLRVRCPGPLASCSPVCGFCVYCCVCGVPRPLANVLRCALGLLCCVLGVLGHLAPVHRWGSSVCCAVCGVSWATWLLFSGVPARCVVLFVRCPGRPGSCLPVYSLSALCFMCAVLGHLAPVQRCARSACYVVCAVSWATWLLFTSVLAQCAVLRVRCPKPLDSCAAVCRLSVLCCVCGVLGLLAPVHRCAGSACCFACAVSWATWILFTRAHACCAVLRVRCPGPLASCSPMCALCLSCCVCGVLDPLANVLRCALGLLCCVLGVLRQLAPVHRCACCVCFALCSVCSFLGHLAPVHRCARLLCYIACVRRRCGSRTRQSGQGLFVAGRGWVPSGRAHVHPDGGSFVAGRGWVRCWVCTRLSGRQLVLPGTCLRAVVCCVLCALSRFAAPGGGCCLAHVCLPWLWAAACLSGVPLGLAWCAAPRPVRSLSVLQSAFPTPWWLSPPRRLLPPDLLGGCAGRAEAGQE